VTLRRVGIVGLGIMGSAIAANLVRKGFDVRGFDIAADAVARAGVTSAATVAALSEGTEVMLLCLPSAAALEDTVAALTQAKPDRARIVVETSTLALDAKLAAQDRLETAGLVLLDCPLSGTGAQAVSGDLAVFASGDPAALEQCAPVFAGFARVTHHVGAFGNGTKMKFIANLLVAIHNVAAAEAVLLGLRAGLDPKTLVAVAGSGAGASRMLEMRGPLMVEDRFRPAAMKLDVWQKDMDLITAFAAGCGVVTPLFAATKPLYEQAVDAGWADADTAAVFKVLEGMAR
jgi:3-hydroxyisobutyrate dehydrogenase-like beta-hydroxyacid dehydrogenase